MKMLAFTAAALLATSPAAVGAAPVAAAGVRQEQWQPAAGFAQTPLWPGSLAVAKPMPGPENVRLGGGLVAARHWTAIENVSRPTMTVYPAKGPNTGAAVLVLPGGGFQVLAIDLEGTEVCDWLTAKGITCALLKYRVPGLPYDRQCDCRPDNYVLSVPALDDVQRAMRLIRFGASRWHIDPRKIGVIGFSAGGYLVAEISTNFDRGLYQPVDAADRESARPDFALAIYPGHLDVDGKLNPNVPVGRNTPPTFLVQAEDDRVDGVTQSLVYYAALKAADVPVEMHLYARGGHAFGLRPTQLPITRWPALAEQWLRTIGILSGDERPEPATGKPD